MTTITTNTETEAALEAARFLRESTANGAHFGGYWMSLVAELIERLVVERDNAKKLLSMRPFQPTAVQAMERIEHFCKTDELEEGLEKTKRERDEAKDHLTETRRLLALAKAAHGANARVRRRIRRIENHDDAKAISEVSRKLQAALYENAAMRKALSALGEKNDSAT